jgi:sulfite dehydrogenase (cytochrome) subunit B
MTRLSRPGMALAALFGLAAGPTLLAAETPGEMTIDLPQEGARLKPGPGMDAAARSCMTCHSVDYIYTQPPLTRDQWTATVTKMKKVFGAPIPDNDVDTIVNYLMTQNGTR